MKGMVDQKMWKSLSKGQGNPNYKKIVKKHNIITPVHIPASPKILDKKLFQEITKVRENNNKINTKILLFHAMINAKI
mgnify:CR=1 FL=1